MTIGEMLYQMNDNSNFSSSIPNLKHDVLKSTDGDATEMNWNTLNMYSILIISALCFQKEL